jgi:hypothetical protein
MERFPRLHSFAIDGLASVKDILYLDDPIDAFHLPLSTQAFEEFREFNHLINQTRSTANEKDLWSYSWGTSFSAKIYKLNFEHIQAPLFSPWIWKLKCTPKIKSFFWLLANDHLSIKDMLIRKNFNLNDNGLC